MLNVTLIVPTYKDPQSLKLILDALELQTYSAFEVIIAEDDNSQEVIKLLASATYRYPIKHYSHEDRGNRKAKAVNAAIAMSEGKYIITIDGDTIPYSTFIQAHVALSKEKTALCGRRLNLGDGISLALRSGSLQVKDIEHHFLRYLKHLVDDKARHIEQGIYLKPHSLIQRIFSCSNNNAHILASNFSCFKSDLLEVNGIDEDLPFAPCRDDTDLEWRLKAIGVNMVSCKYSAILLHLNHGRSDRRDEERINLELIAQKQLENRYCVSNGIMKT